MHATLISAIYKWSETCAAIFSYSSNILMLHTHIPPTSHAIHLLCMKTNRQTNYSGILNMQFLSAYNNTPPGFCCDSMRVGIWAWAEVSPGSQPAWDTHKTTNGRCERKTRMQADRAVHHCVIATLDRGSAPSFFREDSRVCPSRLIVWPACTWELCLLQSSFCCLYFVVVVVWYFCYIAMHKTIVEELQIE